MNKAELRRVLSERRKNIADKPALDTKIIERAKSLVSGNVMVYVSIGSEIRTDELIAALLRRSDVTLYVPYTECNIISPKRLVEFNGEKPNNCGNLPDSSYAHDSGDNLAIKLDFCITPLLGFNDDGYRIGYGKGCYDRFFARYDTVKIGLAYENSRVRFLPDFNDIPLDCCVTEEKVLYF